MDKSEWATCEMKKVYISINSVAVIRDDGDGVAADFPTNYYFRKWEK